MTAKPSAPLSRSVLLAYGAPAFVVALPTLPVYIHLPTLYGVELGDPLIGYVSDRFPVGGRRRKPWIALGAAIAGFGLVHLLSPPAGIGPAYLLTWSLVLYLGWTLVAVPYQAWGAELSGAYDQRTSITGWREGFAVVGMVG
ncbi:MAG: MFS transporter, partial [Rhodospirillaceae bacterium]